MDVLVAMFGRIAVRIVIIDIAFFGFFLRFDGTVVGRWIVVCCKWGRIPVDETVSLFHARITILVDGGFAAHPILGVVVIGSDVLSAEPFIKLFVVEPVV